MEDRFGYMAVMKGKHCGARDVRTRGAVGTLASRHARVLSRGVDAGVVKDCLFT